MIKDQLFEPPGSMDAFRMWIEHNNPTEHGKYAIVDIQPSPEEQNHIVLVIDENGRPMTGIRVVFGFDSGPHHDTPKRTKWRGQPRVTHGNVQYALLGLAKHTAGEGGEDIWIHNIEDDGWVRYSSDIAKNCSIVPAVLNNHTAVMITFQLQRAGVVPEKDMIADMANRLGRLEEDMADMKRSMIGEL